MKQKKILKRMLSLLLAIVLVAGTITVMEPKGYNTIGQRKSHMERLHLPCDFFCTL